MGKGGIVYLLGDTSNDGIYKIGVTRGDIQKRINLLQTGNSGEIYVINTYETKFPFFLESHLHRKFAPYKVLNEWYELDKDTVSSFKDVCVGIEEMIEALKSNPFFKYDKLK